MRNARNVPHDSLTRADLPTPRRPGSFTVLAVCAGNICRSPILDVVISKRFEDRPEVEVRSGGTGDWHVGHRMDSRAAYALAVHGYDGDEHRAQVVSRSLLTWADLVLVADQENAADVLAVIPAADAERVRFAKAFIEHRSSDVFDDPYYGGDDGFTDTVLSAQEVADGLYDAYVSAQR